jgi:hypothetical protein
MSEIFISYKSEDVRRIAPLAFGLQGCGFSVWWDRYLPGGENWHAEIQNALADAKCVVVVWTHATVGQAGDFVRDEAREGKRRGILVPVNLDGVPPPLGFGEIQAIDLRKWNGSTQDLVFQDLVDAVRAKIEARSAPAPKGPTMRLRRRLTYGAVLSALAAAVGAFGSNTFHLQDKACAAPQAVSDFCGALGLGGRPGRVERLAWQALRPGNCDDLKAYLGRFPDGAYRATAHGLLADHHQTETTVWTPGERELVLEEGESDDASRTLAQAKADALGRAQQKAETLCRNFGVTTGFRFKAAKPKVDRLHCDKVGTGFSCEVGGQAICELGEKTTKVSETCGK